MGCSKPHALVSRIKVMRAEKLPADPKGGSIDPYVIIRCEGEKVQSVYRKTNLDPKWDIEAIYYRKKPSLEPITVEVWNHNLISDDFMGMATIDEQGGETPKELTKELFGKKKKEA